MSWKNARSALPQSTMALALFAAAVAGAQEIPAALDLGVGSDGADHVWARLVSATDAAVPGDTLLVAVHLKHEEDWHTYWRNGGDSGMPTEIRWELPDGVEAGPILWPTPHEYVDAAGFVSYGYDGDVALLTEIRVPADLAGPLTLRARVDWLMCRELCIPDGEDVELELPVRLDAAPTTGFDAELIAAAVERLPGPDRNLDLGVALELQRIPLEQKTRAIVRIPEVQDPASAEITWFPFGGDQILAERAVTSVREREIFLELPFELIPGGDADAFDWGGVLDLRIDGRRHFVELPIRLELAGDGERLVANEDPILRAYVGDFEPAWASVGDATSAHGFWRILLFALIGGALLNVMPCVLPVLSLKVMGFISHAGARRSTLLQLGLLFAAGVMLSFLALAVVVIGVQAAGDQLGWGFQFQNPVFVVVMAAVVFAFGLSLFGVYEIILPIGFGSGGSGSAQTESFMSGILATALATPCTAPFLGTALGFAFTQPWYGVLAIFLTVGLGLSLPYVLLSANPAWLRFVPRPGAWMERFKQGMGFLLMGTLVWLLWVLSRQLGAEAVIWTLAFLCALGFGLWMYGSFVDLTSGQFRRLSFLALLIAITVGSGYAFLREPLRAEVDAPSTAEASGDWLTFSMATLAGEVNAGKTVFLDFTADWCTTCKVNEKTVLADEEVESRMRELGVVKMVGDYTRRDAEITRMLRSFGRSGVPLYVIYPAGRLDSPRLLPEVITKGIVLEALEAAGPSHAETAMKSSDT